jgi:uncharacterized protein YqgC (DUF456 family)
MTIATITAILLLAAVLLAGWLMAILGLPGNWLIVLGAVLYSLLGPEGTPPEMAVLTVVILLVLAFIGEILEFALGAVTAARAGGNRRATVGALAGGVAGAVSGMFAGLPIPIVGPLIAAVLFAAFGALVGAYMAQRSMPDRRDQDKAWQIGKAAFWGRLGGTFSKVVVSTLMVAVAVVALLLE